MNEDKDTPAQHPIMDDSLKEQMQELARLVGGLLAREWLRRRPEPGEDQPGRPKPMKTPSRKRSGKTLERSPGPGSMSRKPDDVPLCGGNPDGQGQETQEP